MKPSVLVIGAAKSGVAVAKLLNRHGYAVIITDMQEIKEKAELQERGIQVYEKGHPGNGIDQTDIIYHKLEGTNQIESVLPRHLTAH